MFELVFENPCPVNTPVGVAEFVKQAGLVGSTVAGVHAEQPAEAFDGVTGVALESTPCFFTDFIDGFIESFDQMEAVDDESGVRAVVLGELDCSDLRSRDEGHGGPWKRLTRGDISRWVSLSIWVMSGSPTGRQRCAR